jgi:hypothetical protein
MTTERGRRLQPELRVPRDTRRSGRASHAGSGRWSGRSRIRQEARPGPSWPCGCPRTDAHHEVTGAATGDADAERADTDAGHRTSTPGHWTADAWTSRPLDGHTGRVDIACADARRSHRTLDTGLRTRTDATEYADGRPRHDRHPDRHPGPPHHRPPAGIANRGPVDGACGARQRSRLGDGEEGGRCLSAVRRAGIERPATHGVGPGARGVRCRAGGFVVAKNTVPARSRRLCTRSCRSPGGRPSSSSCCGLLPCPRAAASHGRSWRRPGLPGRSAVKRGGCLTQPGPGPPRPPTDQRASSTTRQPTGTSPCCCGDGCLAASAGPQRHRLTWDETDASGWDETDASGRTGADTEGWTPDGWTPDDWTPDDWTAGSWMTNRTGGHRTLDADRRPTPWLASWHCRPRRRRPTLDARWTLRRADAGWASNNPGQLSRKPYKLRGAQWASAAGGRDPTWVAAP